MSCADASRKSLDQAPGAVALDNATEVTLDYQDTTTWPVWRRPPSEIGVQLRIFEVHKVDAGRAALLHVP